jgi:hypothetical protein
MAEMFSASRPEFYDDILDAVAALVFGVAGVWVDGYALVAAAVFDEEVSAHVVGLWWFGKFGGLVGLYGVVGLDRIE